MSTRGCIIELKKDVCKVGYLHYGANFASKLIHYGKLGLTFTEDVLKTDIEMEQKEGVINIDAEIFIFIEKRGNDSFDVTKKRTMDVEEEDTEEEWAKVPEKLKVLLLENRKEETKFIRTCVGID